MTAMKSGLRTALCLSLLTLAPIHSMAQEADDFSPDSPGATTGVGIMPQGKLTGKPASHTNGTEGTVRTNVRGLSILLCFVSD